MKDTKETEGTDV